MSISLPANRALSYGSKVKIGERLVVLAGKHEGKTGTLLKTKDNDTYYYAKYLIKFDAAGVPNEWLQKTTLGYLLDQGTAEEKAKPSAARTAPSITNIKAGDRLRVVNKEGIGPISPLKDGQIVTFAKVSPINSDRIVVDGYPSNAFLPRIFEFVEADAGTETPEQLVNRLFEAKVKAMDEGIAEIRATMLKSIKDEINARFNIKVK